MSIRSTWASWHLLPPFLGRLLLPASLGENNYSTGAAFEGGLDSPNGYGLRGVLA